MGRKTKLVTIADEGRDKGKTFLLKEMDAIAAEKWGYRAALGLIRGGLELPGYRPGMGIEAVVMAGLFNALSRLTWEELEPLLDELLRCVTIIPDLAGNSEFARKLVPDDTEEIFTLIRLRAEVWTLHTGFFLPVNQPT